MEIIKNIILFLGWCTVFFFSVMFALRISLWYLFTSPLEWAEMSSNLLYNLGNLYIPAFGIYLHFWCGFFILILGIVVILPITRKYMIMHRTLGTAYIVLCILTSIGGNIFIYTTGTVGGINMDIAFSLYGWLLFGYAIITYIYARKKDITSHSRWAIRLWALGLSSLFYRLSYAVLELFGYMLTTPSDFYRPIDRILDWWFFIIPLVCAEIYIRLC